MPGIESHIILPERLPRGHETILLGNETSELNLEKVLGLVIHVEFLEPVAEDVIWMRIRLHGFLI